MNLTDRISLLELCDREFPNGTAVEIGVAGGHFSKQILATWKSLDQLILVDSWKHFPEGYSDACNLPQNIQDERYERVRLDFRDEPKAIIWKLTSEEAAKCWYHEGFYHGAADFIYLDANHSTPAVRADLEAWWPKLKPGGIISGHDYMPGNNAGYGVKQAVDNFAAEWDLKVYQTTQEYCRKSGIYGAGWEGFSFAMRKPI